MTFASFLPTNQNGARLNLANGEAGGLILDQWAARLGGDQLMACAPTAVPYPDILSRNYRGYGLKWLLQSDNILYCIYLCCSQQRRGDITQICYWLSTYTLPGLRIRVRFPKKSDPDFRRRLYLDTNLVRKLEFRIPLKNFSLFLILSIY